MLFAGMAVVMAFPGPVKYKSDWRDRGLHHGGYPIKVGLWLICNVLPFFFPNPVIGVYGEHGLAPPCPAPPRPAPPRRHLGPARAPPMLQPGWRAWCPPSSWASRC
jgi:hypothetical protein